MALDRTLTLNAAFRVREDGRCALNPCLALTHNFFSQRPRSMDSLRHSDASRSPRGGAGAFSPSGAGNMPTDQRPRLSRAAGKNPIAAGPDASGAGWTLARGSRARPFSDGALHRYFQISGGRLARHGRPAPAHACRDRTDEPERSTAVLARHPGRRRRQPPQ